MKAHLKLLALAALILIHSAPAQNPGDNLFSGIQIHTINIIFPQPDYWDSLTVYYNENNEQYIPATVVADGVVFDSVGVRFKGHASYTHINNKKPFRLSFDQYLGSQRWDGVKGVHLNNFWEDPSFMREKIHLDFCRDAGIAAPRANYVQLSINDTLFGFYSLVEHVDKRFLTSRYGEDEGDLFKSTDAFEEAPLADFKWYGPHEADYYPHYELKTEESTTAWPRLLQLLDTLHHSSSLFWTLPAQANLQSFYKAVAADILFGNMDSYVKMGQNFYFYFRNATNKMEWIVWDAGLSFGGMPPSGGEPDIENLSITYVGDSTDRPLMGNVLGTPLLRNEYLRSFCKVFSGYFSSTRLFPHIDSVANTIRPYVYADFRNEYTVQNFEDNIGSDINVGSGRKPGLKSFITMREASVESQLTNLGVSCALPVGPRDIVINEFMAENDSILDSSGEPEDWIELFNNTNSTVDLSGMYLSNDPGNPTMWQFPANTTVLPNSFMIVWADSDVGQPGVHANFLLPLDGGFIQLSNTDGSWVDSVSYGPQATNRSMSRIPNGLGPLKQGYNTFDQSNGDSVRNDPVLTTIVFPRYIEGINGTNTNRIPFAYRARISGLAPDATYRFTNQVVISSDLATTNGAGNCIFVPLTGSFVRTSSPNLSTNYGSFTTDATGMFEGWFVTEPTGNARFVPSKHVFMRIALNDGAGGTTVATRLTSADSIRVVRLDPAANDSCGTGLRCTSLSAAKDFVFAYDNATGTGRPISGSFVESDGSDNSAANSFAAFYANDVNGVDGAFGLVVPNVLPDGIRRFERRSFTSGGILETATDDDGVWPSGVSTVHPSGGTSALVLTVSDVTLPVQLVAFSARVLAAQSVRLDWKTISEINNYGFFVQRKSSGQLTWDEPAGSFIAGHGTTNAPHDYSFIDQHAPSGSLHYRLRQVDLDGTSHFSEPIAVNTTTSVEQQVPKEFSLKQNYPNPFNPSTEIVFSVEQNGPAALLVYNLIGQQVATLFNQSALAGQYYTIRFDASTYPSGIYFYRLNSGGKVATRRMTLLK